MLPIEFEGSQWIGKPKDMTDEQCSGIYGKIGVVPTTEERTKWFCEALEAIPPESITETMIEHLKTFFLTALQKIKPVNFFGLPIEQGKDVAGFYYFCTAWKPRKEDLEALNRGEPFYVKTISNGLPPMWIFTIDENNEANI